MKSKSTANATVVVNLNIYNEEQLINWALSNKKRPVVYARLNPHTKNMLEALVTLKETTKAAFIEALITSAVQTATKQIQSDLLQSHSSQH